MYNKSNYDHIFYRMKKTIPKSIILFIIITVIKIYPLFLLSHTPGYKNPPNKLSSIHSYYKYFTLSYYMGNSISSKGILIIIIIIMIFNIILIIILLIYLRISKNVQQIDENYGDVESLGPLFAIFSNIVFFKYIVLFQFFNEINFFPIICIGNIDYNTIDANNIFGSSYKNKVNQICENKFIYISLSTFNIIVDIGYNILISSRFYDLNILSNYIWNFTPDFIMTFEFLESYSQIFFILFLFFNNKVFHISFIIYISFVFIINFIGELKSKTFYTAKNYILQVIRNFAARMSYISTLYISLFILIKGSYVNDLEIIILIVIEIVLVILMYKIEHRNDMTLIKSILVEPLNELSEKNIYSILIFTLKEFSEFNEINNKLDSNNFDNFLFNYIEHLKKCNDLKCPCKGYLQKSEIRAGGFTTTKQGGKGTHLNIINSLNLKNEKEYILNAFFNVLASNLKTTLKNTKLTNIELEGKETDRQRIIHQLRTELILAVKKLLSYKLEKLVKQIETSSLRNSFNEYTKDFIRINFYSFSLKCNESYYKTLFYYYEYLSDYFRKKRIYSKEENEYEFNFIYYLYLRMYGINEYNKYMSLSGNKGIKNEDKSQQNIKLDFIKILSLCNKYYEIEDKLMKNLNIYETFIEYFLQENLIFNDLINLIRKLMNEFKELTNYIIHYFKNDKINNLFICTKIILFFKVLHFQIPDYIENKLTTRIHDLQDTKKNENDFDSNYYLILNYLNGEFLIKYLSHELLIILGYNENDLKNKDFHILMPQKLRKLHKQRMIDEIKTKTSNWNNKEIFFNTNNDNCILFDIQYKVLLNLRGEITILAIILPKKTIKDVRTCFICMDNLGEILSMNKEFEDYFLITKNMIDSIKIDSEKLILQNMSIRMKNFFKDEANTEFQELFDYELYLQSLFGEEFDVLKEKNNKDYIKNYNKWKQLKEMIKRNNTYYTRYIEVNIKQRFINKELIYFIKYSVKVSLNKGVESFGNIGLNTKFMINTINLSMKEMSKIGMFQTMENTSISKQIEDDKKNNEKNKINKNNNNTIDDNNISKDEIESDDEQKNLFNIDIINENNNKSLFSSKKNKGFKYSLKHHFIIFLIISISFLILISIILCIIGFIEKIKFYKELKEIFYLEFNSIILKNNIFLISQSLLTSMFLMSDLLDSKNNTRNKKLEEECFNVIYNELYILDQSTYNISHTSTKYYKKKISLDKTSEEIKNIFYNGYLYIKKNNILFEEITNIKKIFLDYYYIYSDNFENFGNNKTNSNIFKYFLMDYISSNNIQNLISLKDLDINLNEGEIYLYYVLVNIIPNINEFTKLLINNFNNLLKNEKKLVLIKLGLFKFSELILIIIIIIIEWIFIYLGFKKFRKKLLSIRIKIQKNKIDVTLQKIEEFKKFSDNLNLKSLYYISNRTYKEKVKKHKNSIFLQELTPNGNTPFNNSTKKETINENTKNEFDNNNCENSIKNGKESLEKNKNELSSFNNKTSKINENKNNLWKMMQKLEKIKSGDNESKINDENSKKNENQINEDSQDIPIKTVLRNNYKNELDVESENIINLKNKKIGIKDEEEKGDDSKITIFLNNNDIKLNNSQKRKKKEMKVQFKGKDIKYYSPEERIVEQNESQYSERIKKDDSKIQENSYNTNSKTNEIINTPYEILTPDEDDKEEIQNDSTIIEKIINKDMTIEEVENRINNMLSTNFIEKLLLGISFILFLIIYVLSFIFNCIYNNKINKAREYTYYYYNKHNLLTEIIFNYQIHIIRNIHDSEINNNKINLNYLINDYKKNLNEQNDFINNNNLATIFKETSYLEEITNGNNFCEEFSEIYLKYETEIEITSKELKNQCLTTADKMNINGLIESESYMITTISVLIEDWKNIYKSNIKINNFKIIELMNESKLINLIEEVIFILRKFTDILLYCLTIDFNNIFDSVILLEKVFCISSMILLVFFFIFSLLLIIYPIRSVDIIVNWFSSKYCYFS